MVLTDVVVLAVLVRQDLYAIQVIVVSQIVQEKFVDQTAVVGFVRPAARQERHANLANVFLANRNVMEQNADRTGAMEAVEHVPLQTLA